MGKKGIEFSSAGEIREEIAQVVKGFADLEKGSRWAQPLLGAVKLTGPDLPHGDAASQSKGFPFVLSASEMEHLHRGFPLTAWVEGANQLFPDGVIEMDPGDARAAGVSDGDDLVVEAPGFKNTWRAKISDEQKAGELHVTLRCGEHLAPNPCRVSLRKKNV
jgi:predicted molibdopterin-dependent oxidoreductase YjgC